MTRNLSGRKNFDPVSRDGIRDSLTRLGSTAYFYQVLDREISISRREPREITIVRFQLKNMKPEYLNDYEYEVIDFSKMLSRTSRSSDLISRAGKLEFLILLQVDPRQASIYVNRVKHSWKSDRYDLLHSISQLKNDESAVDCVKRTQITFSKKK